MKCPFCGFTGDIESEETSVNISGFFEEYITPPEFTEGESYMIYWCPRCDEAHKESK